MASTETVWKREDAPWENAPLPRPVYGCSNSYCAEEVSYPADMLIWWDGNEKLAFKPGWYCTSCLDQDMGYEYCERKNELGVPLSEEIERRQRDG